MIRSQCWFTFDFILHQIFWSPLRNDVKQLLIAAIMPSKVRFFHSENLGINDGPAILHDVVFCFERKFHQKSGHFWHLLTPLLLIGGPCLMIFLASIWLLTCVLRTHLNELVQTMCAPSSYVGRKGDLEGPFVRDTSQDHKSSGKCPPGFPLTTSALVWTRPWGNCRKKNIMVPVVLVIFLVLTGDSSSSSNSQYKSVHTRRWMNPVRRKGSVAGMSNLSMTSDSVLRFTSMCTRAAEYSFHKG